jgi:phosphoribosylformylglycinamidine cyclo-ligase
MGKLDTVGHDIVNHCVNDIFVGGADPLFFLDYLGLGRLVPEEVEQIVKGLATACKANNCSLVGGETAQLPALYKPGDFDLVGFIVGAVEKSGIIDGSTITPGDAIIGIPSSGLHTNGYSLARKVFNTEENPKALSARHSDLGRTLGEALLEPHRSYYHDVKPVIAHVKGMAHITGGGLPGNVPRVLPKGVTAVFTRAAWTVPPLFRMIQRAGSVSDEEMFKVFNMGIGMTIFCAQEHVRAITGRIPDAKVIGSVAAQNGEQRVIINPS